MILHCFVILLTRFCFNLMDINKRKKTILYKTHVVCPSCQGTGTVFKGKFFEMFKIVKNCSKGFLDLHAGSGLPLINKDKINSPLINYDYQKIIKTLKNLKIH